MAESKTLPIEKNTGKEPGKYSNLSGLVFGLWTVVERTKDVGKRGTRYLCLCACGKTRIINGAALSKGRSRSCGCDNPTRFKSKLGGDVATNVLICRYKSSALERGHSFELSYVDCEKLFNSNCTWCGATPYAGYSTGDRNQYRITYTGIDRLDNTKGYTVDNVAACCKVCNRAKNTMSVEQFEAWLNSIVLFRTSACLLK